MFPVYSIGLVDIQRHLPQSIQNRQIFRAGTPFFYINNGFDGMIDILDKTPGRKLKDSEEAEYGYKPVHPALLLFKSDRQRNMVTGTQDRMGRQGVFGYNAIYLHAEADKDRRGRGGKTRPY